MAFAETANLAVKLTLGGNFTSQMSKARASLRGFDKDASRAYKAGGQIGTGIKRSAAIAAAGVGVLVAQVGFGLDSLIQLESATAQTNAVIKSTGGVAAQSADSVRKLAEQYESLNATIDDKVIQSAENLLLTFTNVRGNAFEPTLEAALNMNQALGGGPEGLQGVMMKLGKAMNSPAQGFTALKRSGVLFNTEQQKLLKGSESLGKEELKHYLKLKKSDKAAAERYKAGVLNVKLLAAQKLILAELNTEFGGSFLAGGNTTAGSVAKFGDAIEDVQKALATALLPTVRNVADALTLMLADPAVIQGAKDLGKSIGEIFSKDNIMKGIGAIKTGMEAIRTIAGPVADVIRTAVGAFTSLPPDIQKLLVAGFAVNKLTGGLVSNIAGGIFGALKAMTVQAGVVNVTGGIVNGGGIPGAAATGLSGLQKVFLVGEAIGLALLVDEVRNGIADANTRQAEDIHSVADQFVASMPPPGQLQTALDAVNTGIRDLKSNPLNVLVQGEALTNLEEMKVTLERALRERRVKPHVPGRSPRTPASIEAMRRGTERFVVKSPEAMRRGTERFVVKSPSVTTNVDVDVKITAAGIQKTITHHKRYGPPAGSRESWIGHDTYDR